ncbi:MAG: PIN domain-containing protein [Fimbriimonadales bacterium]|nr:PIN domain-containing protein [Fimbriimonadales bacterium]
MRRVFVDSGGWLSVVIKTDRYHTAGVAYYESLLAQRAHLITSDYVLDETITRLRYDVGHDAAKRFLELTQKAAEAGVLEIVFVDETVWNVAVPLFLQYADVRLSFTDCTSFVLIQQLGVQEVFGYDAHFGIVGASLHPSV